MFKLERFIPKTKIKVLGVFETAQQAQEAALKVTASGRYRLGHSWPAVFDNNGNYLGRNTTLYKRVGKRSFREIGTLLVSQMEDLEFLARAVPSKKAKKNPAYKLSYRKALTDYRDDPSIFPISLGYHSTLSQAKKAASDTAKKQYVAGWRQGLGQGDVWYADLRTRPAGQRASVTGVFKIERVDDMEYLASLAPKAKKNSGVYSGPVRLSLGIWTSDQKKPLSQYFGSVVEARQAVTDCAIQFNMIDLESARFPEKGKYRGVFWSHLGKSAKQTGRYSIEPVSDLEYLSSLAKENPVRAAVSPRLSFEKRVVLGYFDSEEEAKQAVATYAASRSWEPSNYWTHRNKKHQQCVLRDPKSYSQHADVLLTTISDLEYLVVLTSPPKSKPQAKRNPMWNLKQLSQGKSLDLGFFDSVQEATEKAKLLTAALGPDLYLGSFTGEPGDKSRGVSVRSLTAKGIHGHFLLTELSDLEYLGSLAKKNSSCNPWIA